MPKRATQVITFRLDVRIIERLNLLAAGKAQNDRARSRNFLVEQILAEKCGLPFYEWKEEDQEHVEGDKGVVP